MTGRRCVFFVGGYDPKTPKAFFDRMARDLRRFETIWGVRTSMTSLPSESDDVGGVTVTASGDDGWHVTTDFHFLNLDSIVAKDFARPLPVRVVKYLIAFLDYWLSGTAFSIFAKSWRFGLYFMYPFVVTVFLLLLPWLAASAALRLAGLDLPGVPAVIALLALFPLMATLGKRWSVLHLMDLWSFSLEYLRGRRPEAEGLMDRFATAIAKSTREDAFDEILLVGHSTGGGLILEIAARALKADPGLAGRAQDVSLVTLGSTALKFGLHPAARAFRRRVQTLVDQSRLKWVEFQCLIDVINFYKTDPAKDMGLAPRKDGFQPFPIVRRVHMRDMVDKATYKRIKRRPFRIHYQFIFAGTRRNPSYDFYAVCFGPMPLWIRAQTSFADLAPNGSPTP